MGDKFNRKFIEILQVRNFPTDLMKYNFICLTVSYCYTLIRHILKTFKLLSILFLTNHEVKKPVKIRSKIGVFIILKQRLWGNYIL